MFQSIPTPLLLVFLLIMIIFLIKKLISKKQESEPEDEPESETYTQWTDRYEKNNVLLAPEQILDTLEKLGYFSFTAPEDLAAVKREIASGYESHQILSTEFGEESTVGLCGRYYLCDGETLFEIGGLEEYLLEVKPIFDRLGIPLKWSNEYWSDDITEHTIVLNGKQYDAFRGNPNDYKIWGWATKNFAEMLNDQLTIHESDEKIYLMGGGNDGAFYILTDAQFAFIRKHFTSDEIPRPVAEWWATP